MNDEQTLRDIGFHIVTDKDRPVAAAFKKSVRPVGWCAVPRTEKVALTEEQLAQRVSVNDTSYPYGAMLEKLRAAQKRQPA